MVLCVITAHCSRSYIVLLAYILLITACSIWLNIFWKNHKNHHRGGKVFFMIESKVYIVIWSQFFDFPCQKRMYISCNFFLSKKGRSSKNCPCFKKWDVCSWKAMLTGRCIAICPVPKSSPRSLELPLLDEDVSHLLGLSSLRRGPCSKCT